MSALYRSIYWLTELFSYGSQEAQIPEDGIASLADSLLTKQIADAIQGYVAGNTSSDMSLSADRALQPPATPGGWS